MIEGTMDELKPQSLDEFNQLLQENSEHKHWKGLILTGSEITLRKDLPELVYQAKKSGFQHVRIQTHGMHLAQNNFCKILLDAGVDEFFVSVAGSDALTHDEITEVSGSFDKMMQGLEHLDVHPHVSLITNTVVTEKSYRLLPNITKRLLQFKQLVQIEFWIYWPMTEHDSKNLIASYGDMLPYLLQAVELAKEHSVAIEIKNFPECMLGDSGSLLHNDQPQLYIDPEFWTQFMRNGFYQCAYREQCASSQCLGLNTAYIEKYGLEEDLLQPLAKSEQTAN
ncbi:MAG: radical SAM protein [Methylococcales bacterium]|nr:radical SAM protein [Methylococcales bacterium]